MRVATPRDGSYGASRRCREPTKPHAEGQGGELRRGAGPKAPNPEGTELWER